jgi:hypothetical protein
MQQQNKAQWQRKSTGLELFVYENNSWKLYTQSINYVPDSNMKGASRGFPTFQKCIKEGYEIIPTPQEQ